MIVDGVLNKPISQVLTDDFDIERFPGGSPKWHIPFAPTLCPGCGWDLNGERDSLVLICKNCNSTWYPDKKELKKVKSGHLPGKGEHLIYLPFWRIKADISGIALDSYADLVKIANLPKTVQDDWHDIGFHFWALGFKVRPRTFLNLTRNLTLSQPGTTPVKELPDARLYPVTLPVSEAIESLKMNLASFMKPPLKLYPTLKNIKIKPESFILVYLPFNEKHHEYLQPDLHLTINKNQLALAKHL
jgi:hypothetical protein